MRRSGTKDKYDLMESGVSSKASEASKSFLEKENEERMSLLKERVSSLRTLATDIGDEVRNQNRFLDEMDNNMTGLRGSFVNTMKRIGAAMSWNEGSGICVLVVFMIVVFVVLWRFLKR